MPHYRSAPPPGEEASESNAVRIEITLASVKGG